MSTSEVIDAIHVIQNLAAAMRLMSDTLGNKMGAPFSQVAFEMEEKLEALEEALRQTQGAPK